MLSPTVDTIRLFLHVFAASIWVGGQVVLGSLVPVVRRSGPDVTRAVARTFARLAWPAFAVVVLTGLWNLSEIDIANTSTEYQVTLMVKVTLAIVSGAAAAVHQVGRSRAALAIGGALGLLGALGAMFLGLVLRTGT